MSQDYDTPDTGATGTKMKDGFDQVTAMIGSVRSHWLGGSEFANIANGDLWLDNTDTTDYVAKLRENGITITLDIKSKLAANKDFNWYFAENFRVENLASPGTHISTSVGRVLFDTTDDRLKFGGNSAFHRIVSAPDTTGIIVDRPIPLSSFQLGATPPTDATKGTTPTVTGYLFDATAETMTLTYDVPTAWVGDSDLVLRLGCVLNQAETAADDIDWTADWVAYTPASGDAVSKTSTNTTATQDIGSANADGDYHVVDITIDHDHADNPVSGGDQIVIEIHRTDLTEVGGVIVTSARMRFYAEDLV